MDYVFIIKNETRRSVDCEVQGIEGIHVLKKECEVEFSANSLIRHKNFEISVGQDKIAVHFSKPVPQNNIKHRFIISTQNERELSTFIEPLCNESVSEKGKPAIINCER